MNTATLISMEEYLDTSYSPDREYVDGIVVERHVGERPHSGAQGNIYFILRRDYPKLFVWPEQRVRTVPGKRSRVPDVCVTLEDPLMDVFETPPFLCIEVLSRRDEMTKVLEKLQEYEAFGVPNIWLFDPRRKKAYTFRNGSLQPQAEALTTADPEIQLGLDDVFRGL